MRRTLETRLTSLRVNARKSDTASTENGSFLPEGAQNSSGDHSKPN